MSAAPPPHSSTTGVTPTPRRSTRWTVPRWLGGAARSPSPTPDDHVELRPLRAGRRLGVDGSMAGRAFRDIEIKAARSDGGHRLWVPVIDGAERLGVLEVVPGEVADLDDGLLHTQLTWLATLLGHLVTTTTKYGDALDVVRRRRPQRLRGARLAAPAPRDGRYGARWSSQASSPRASARRSSRR
ncbi:hypothetical protein [Georgenia sp. SUBG003]|uniref:hypothetical protein n=1 Tax=Georgenia sp. SUBG003 TaxID=1497974 RepID=UPI003AB67E25